MSQRAVDDELGPSPLSTAHFAQKLEAHVCDAHGASIHGYRLAGDLARHYSWLEVMLLVAAGELPEPARVRAAEIALVIGSGVSVAEASGHAVITGQVCGCDSPALIGIAALALAEQAHAQIVQHDELLDWLDGGANDPPPARHVVAGPERAPLLHDLRAAEIEVPATFTMLNAPALQIAVLHWAGLRQRAQLEALLVASRLPVLVTEAGHYRSGDFMAYAMNLPVFECEPPR